MIISSVNAIDNAHVIRIGKEARVQATRYNTSDSAELNRLACTAIPDP